VPEILAHVQSGRVSQEGKLIYPHMQNLLFAVPLTGRPIPVDVMFAFHSMALPMNFNYSTLRVVGKPVDEARNEYAQYAVDHNCKYIFFWDEDVACPPQSIPELIYKMEHHPDIAVCGGIYCLKREPAEPLVFRGNGNGPFWDWKAGEFFEVSGIGMGCTIVRTEVFKDLKKPWFKTEFNYSQMMNGVAALESWTEDLWFCDRVTKTGKWKVYADGSLLCTHYDMATSKGFNLPADSKPVQHLSSPVGKKKILDIGSGKTPYQTKEGKAVTADPDEKNEPDYRCDLRKLPFANAEFDVIFSPALERFPAEETAEVLTEWTRCLKPDGELRLVVSNVEWQARELIAGRVQPAQMITANRATAFTFESLKKSLSEFKEVEKVQSDPAHIAIRAKR
jgi:predicted SAM-dependent methyltransferase